MNLEAQIFNSLIIGWFVLAVVVFISLFFINAPYGRYMRKGWGATINNRLGWLLMESVSSIAFALCYAFGIFRFTPVMVVFLLMWEAHYIHRAFIYPFSLHTPGKHMPLAVMFLAVFFNTANAYLNGRYLFTFSGGYETAWLTDPRFICGAAIFIAGFIINRSADNTLKRIRENGAKEYAVPLGPVYRWVSCPNYLGELMIWFGWALATWSLAGLSFAIWTAANLIPRARAHHRWYREHFADYPQERKALLPGIW